MVAAYVIIGEAFIEFVKFCHIESTSLRINLKQLETRQF
jgi:hypothetical protein